ncbi:condensation domain-containing protein [Streptomyces sioyaensis]|uniref:condensation domain-containing protein n=1 Tax=Streptomyces sioyaensis TaxID=67364 RepID=UPI0033EA0664
MAGHPLSTGQEALWFLHRMNPAGAEYNGAASVHVHAELDMALLESALQATAERHPMLRSTFEDGSSGPVRRVHPGRVPPLERRDAIGAGTEELGKLAEEFTATPFDLHKDLPFRFLVVRTRAGTGAQPERGTAVGGQDEHDDHGEYDGPGETVLVVAAHHIAMDLTTEMLVLGELLHHYGTLVKGEPADLPTPGEYDDFVAQERAALSSARRGRAEAFWRSYCLPLPEDLDFPTDRPRPAVLSAASATWRTTLPQGFSDQLDTAARALGVTPFVYLFSVFQTLLYRRTGREDFLIGYTASCRTRPRTRNIAGYLVNTPPYRVALNPETTFREVVEKSNRNLGEALGHIGYPFAMLPRLLKVPRSRSRPPLVQVLFNFLPSKPLGRMGQSGEGQEQADINGIPVSLGPGSSPPGNYDYIVEVIHLKNTAMLGIQYKTDLFDAATVEKLGQELVTLFDHVRQDARNRVLSMN